MGWDTACAGMDFMQVLAASSLTEKSRRAKKSR
jgi:hypothetical protein